MPGSGPKINSLRGDIMKKIICVVLVFGAIMLCGVSFASAEETSEDRAGVDMRGAPTPPAGHTVRYVLPYFRSRTVSLPRIASMIRVYNHSKKECEIGVQFRKGLTSSDVCSITLAVGSQMSGSFCSRPITDDTLFNCSVSCPDPGLTFDVGHVYVSSPAGCTNLAVDGQIIYSDAADTTVSGTSSLRVVKYGSPSKGD
jgi:hypothetical protein